MNYPTSAVFLILLAHFIGDFFLQTQAMAEQKSEKKSVLILHSLLYGSALFIFSPFISLTVEINFITIWSWVTVNMFLHGLFDMIFADIYKHYVNKSGFKRGFFNALAVDQMVHIVSLFGLLTLISLES